MPVKKKKKAKKTVTHPEPEPEPAKPVPEEEAPASSSAAYSTSQPEEARQWGEAAPEPEDTAHRRSVVDDEDFRDVWGGDDR